MNRSDDMRKERGRRPLRRRDMLKLAVATSVAAVLAACGGSTATNTPKPAGTTAASGATTPAATTAPAATAATSSSATAATKPAGSAAATTGTIAASPAATTSAATGNLTVSKSGFKGTLQYWVLGYQPNGGNTTGKLMDAAVANFTKANPDIKVEVTGYTGDQDGFTKLTQAVQGGSSVDIFRLPSDILPLLVQDGLVAPIDDFLTADDKGDLIPNVFDSVKINGKAYAWPLWV
ncbi:MAG: extracellular solute-binding protein, partial [Chloroflexota bacterium]|nr:extracellular solute-binding protein [Chloroflexota bacterium]